MNDRTIAGRGVLRLLNSVEPVQSHPGNTNRFRFRSTDIARRADRERTRTPAPGEPTLHDLNVLALIKGGERFVYVYDDESRPAVIAALRDQAADPAVSLNWFDAAVLTKRARQQATRSDEPSRI